MHNIIYQASPVMFRNKPLSFVLCCLVPVLGWAILLGWWIKCKGETVMVTNGYIRQRRGIISRTENTIMLDHVRDVELRQNILQRLLDVGHLGVSSAAAIDGSIELFGYAHPSKIRDLIYK
ncbi:MAG: PH domain-containing protein [Verrucomicrobiota bacterium]